MAVIDRENVLKGLTVQEAMRRVVISIHQASPIEQAIRFTIKYKANALLVTNESREGTGLVSKTLFGNTPGCGRNQVRRGSPAI